MMGAFIMNSRFSAPSTVIPNLNVPTAAAINAIEKFVDKQVDHSLPGYDYLQRSVARYKQAIYDLQPLPVTQYMDRHLKDGLSYDEMRIFVAALALRVLPTMGDLLGHSSLFRGADLHTDALVGNINDEVGGHKNYKSHIQHFFESLREMSTAFRFERESWMEDIQSYAMMYRLILLRREGITFPRTGDSASFAAFQAECDKRGWVLPHTVAMQVAGGPAMVAAEDPEKAIAEGRKISNQDSMATVFPIERNKAYEKTWFRTAQEYAELLPDEAIDFRIANAPGFREAKDPSDKREMMFRALNTLSRECSAAKGSHIETFGNMLRAYKERLGHCFKRAIFWSDIHVGTIGVEDEHARKAREEAIAVMHASKNDPYAIAYALDEVVNNGYLAQQKHHWEHVVAALEKCRADPNHEPIPTSNKASFRDRASQPKGSVAAR